MVANSLSSRRSGLAPTTPQELDGILRADIATFSEVVKLAGLRAK